MLLSEPNNISMNQLKSATQNSNSAILATNLTKHVGQADNVIEILRNLHVEVAKGESIAIVGSSGSGKSTLLGLLAGLDNPTSGSVMVEGAPFSSLNEDARASVRGKRMGFVFQSFQLLGTMTALENVMLPLQLASKQNVKHIALETLAKVGLADRSTHYPKQLSGGEQQRVAIARAFAPQPAILFADEPTGNLDTTTGERIIELLFSLNLASNSTLILVTHDTQLAQRCQRVLTLRDGQLHAS